MATFRPGDAVEYTGVNTGYQSLKGAVGVVEQVSDKSLWVTWVSLPNTVCRNMNFVICGAKEHWMIENFRKLGATDGNIREG